LDNRYPGPCVHDCAAQLPHRYRRHDQDLAGRRVCSQRSDGLDGKVLRRWWGIANANCNSYCHAYGHANTDAHAYGHIYSNTYCHAYGHANTYCHADGHTNTDAHADSYAHADSNAYCNCPRKPDAYTNRNSKRYTQAYSNPATSANSRAAPVARIEVVKAGTREKTSRVSVLL
jgi:hypothetical protein